MKPDSFLENFGHVVNAPNGVQSIRDMVLGLAVTGRLSTTHETDTAAEECFRRCRNHFERLVAEGRIRRELARSDAVTTDSFGLIPPTWVWSTIGEVTSYGSTEKAEFVDVSPSTWVLELEDIEKGTSKIVAKVRAGERRFKSSKNRFSPGQVLYGKLRPYLNKVVIADEPGVCTTEIVPILAFDGLEPEYLHLFLKSPRFRTFATNSTHGMNLPRLGTSAARSAPFPLPPLEEQKRIVTKVDELMRLCDRLEAQQQEREKLLPLLSRANHSRFVANPTLDNLVSIFRSPEANEIEDIQCTVINLALQGRLTSQEKRDSPANEALFNVRQIKGISSSSIETVASLHQVPSSWTWIRVKDLVPEFQNGVSSRGDADGTPVVVLRLADIRDRKIVISEPRFIPIRQSDQRKYSLNKGDVLITRVNGSADIVGTFILVDNALDAIYCDHFIRMRIDQKVIVPKFLNLIGDSPLIRQQIRRLFVTTAGQKTVNQTHIGSLAFPLPPVNEQNRIVEIVERLMDTARDLQMKRRQSLATLESFANAAVAAITSTEFTENEKMQAPKTKVITALKVTKEPKKTDKAPLASLLFQQGGEVSAKALWKQSDFSEIDAFYRQLKTEMANGWIEEDTSKREVNEVEVG